MKIGAIQLPENLISEDIKEFTFKNDQAPKFLKSGEGVEVKEKGKALELIPIPNPGASTLGATLVIDEEYEALFRDNRVRITIYAKGKSGAEFKALYSTAQVGNSGWQTFELTEEYEKFSFEYQVPNALELQKDYLFVLPISKNMYVKSITFLIVN